MSIEITGLVISGISALASIVQAWKAARKEEKELTVDQVELAAIPKTPVIEEKEIVLLSKAIPDEILEAILENINKAKKRFADAIKDPACNKQCEDKEHEIAASEICGELQRIKHLNNHKLPQDLEKLWIAFQ